MKDTSEPDMPVSRQLPSRPQTKDERNGTALSTHHSQNRPFSNVHNHFDGVLGLHGKPGLRLTSLSALYQPAFKPYSFSHMYDTKYNADFQGRYWPRPLPERAASANFAPIKSKFGSSTYQQHFQTRDPFSLAFVVPYSRHRHNNPQPKMVNSYNYPDGTRWIWKPASSVEETSTQGDPQPKTPMEKIRYHRWYSR